MPRVAVCVGSNDPTAATFLRPGRAGLRTLPFPGAFPWIGGVSGPDAGAGNAGRELRPVRRHSRCMSTPRRMHTMIAEAAERLTGARPDFGIPGSMERVPAPRFNSLGRRRSLSAAEEKAPRAPDGTGGRGFVSCRLALSLRHHVARTLRFKAAPD